MKFLCDSFGERILLSQDVIFHLFDQFQYSETAWHGVPQLHFSLHHSFVDHWGCLVHPFQYITCSVVYGGKYFLFSVTLQ